ncbi:hypothetical protein TRFO_35408 [Tritrichomonas foetus]|uniref:ATPase V1 complex subunit H C-terminal domain-containing protein n=1 Tax=Tritrichomonas foetus TaxID=1144522 RepID=A0A1J4JGG5_9EUKA|nr:hypothetical protein TRFO_35408 [Tritrichomonas foetus]|eukprot:OHS98248.1 hypothetical protein TRFO_35408 [Tritrichomonas foetus]
MLAQNSSIHPLFVRLDARDAIFRNVQTNTLVLENDNSKHTTEFIELFKVHPEQQKDNFTSEKSHHPRAFAKLLEKRNVTETLNLLFAFIDRLFDIDFTSTIAALVPQADGLISQCTNILLGKFDERFKCPFLIRTNLLLLGALLSHPDVKISKNNSGAAATYVDKVTKLLGGDLVEASLALEGLKRFLSLEKHRQMFVDANGVKLLINLLTAAGKLSQNDTTYHILFCIWALTYSPDGAGQLSTDEFVSILGRMLSVQSVKSETEIIIRLMVAIVKQLNSNTVFIESAYDNDILRLLRMYQTKHYVDPELQPNIVAAADELNKGLKHLSLWDKYVREVNSGTLRFSVSHKSELFWKANIERFGEGQYAVLVALKKLLSSDDEETVVVACHDLGEYATRSPIGRVKLEEIGAKDAVMKLMSSEKQAVQREALRTTQLLLLRNQTA